MMEGLARSFLPVADAATRVLVLGSLPGRKSLERQQYYAKPQNKFWYLAGAVLGAELVSLDYDARLAALLAGGMGVWDVLESAERVGSLDANIRNPQANLLAEFVATLPALRVIGFNGMTAAAEGRRQLGGTGIPLLTLPSSSARYPMPFEQKRNAWLRLRDYL